MDLDYSSGLNLYLVFRPKYLMWNFSWAFRKAEIIVQSQSFGKPLNQPFVHCLLFYMRSAYLLSQVVLVLLS